MPSLKDRDSKREERSKVRELKNETGRVQVEGER